MTEIEINLRIDAKATGWQRTRVNHTSRRHYNDPKTERGEANVVIAWIDTGSPRLPDGPIVIQVEVALDRPQSHWRADGTLTPLGERAPWPTKKPDADNCLKLVMDALNKRAYRDDAQVVHAWVVKRWANPGETEHTTVLLRPAPTPLTPSIRAAA